MYRKLILAILLMPVTLMVCAQVTVGSSLNPEEGAILDIKTFKEFSPGGNTVNKEDGGLLLPRVYLSSRTSLYFIDPPQPGGSTQEYEKYAGLMIYNLSSTSDGLRPGLCVWNGSEWQTIGETNYSINEDAWLLSGNKEINENIHFVGTTDAKSFSMGVGKQPELYVSKEGKVGVHTVLPTADFHIEGNLKVRNLPVRPSVEVLGIDNTSQLGKITKQPAQKPKLLFAQSNSSQYFEDVNKMNNGTEIVITWSAGDFAMNDLTTFNASTHTFTFKEDALCSVNGYVNYVPFGVIYYTFHPDRNERFATVDVIIQHQKVGSTTWENVCRGNAIWELGATRDIAQTVITSDSVKKYQKGDKIRMVIKRPSATLGMNHNNDTDVSYIAKPTGSSFSKGLKVSQILDK